MAESKQPKYEPPRVAVLVDQQNMLYKEQTGYDIEDDDILDVARFFGNVHQRYICTSSRIPYDLKSRYKSKGWEILQGNRSADGYVVGKAVEIAIRQPEINRIALATGDAYAEGAIDIIKDNTPTTKSIIIASSIKSSGEYVGQTGIRRYKINGQDFADTLTQKTDYFVFLEPYRNYFEQEHYDDCERIPLINLLKEFRIKTEYCGDVSLQGLTKRGLKFIVSKVPYKWSEMSGYGYFYSPLERLHEENGGKKYFWIRFIKNIEPMEELKGRLQKFRIIKSPAEKKVKAARKIPTFIP